MFGLGCATLPTCHDGLVSSDNDANRRNRSVRRSVPIDRFFHTEPKVTEFVVKALFHCSCSLRSLNRRMHQVWNLERLGEVAVSDLAPNPKSACVTVVDI